MVSKVVPFQRNAVVRLSLVIQTLLAAVPWTAVRVPEQPAILPALQVVPL